MVKFRAAKTSVKPPYKNTIIGRYLLIFSIVPIISMINLILFALPTSTVLKSIQMLPRQASISDFDKYSSSNQPKQVPVQNKVISTQIEAALVQLCLMLFYIPPYSVLILIVQKDVVAD